MGSTNLWKTLKDFNLLSLLENETMKMFSVAKRTKSKHKFGGMKVCEADKVREYFINLKIENEALD